MKNEAEGSVTRWIGDLKAGDTTAAQKLWERYFTALVRLARSKLRTRHRAAVDEEDIALGVFDSFCAAVTQGRFPQLDDRDDLWRVLVTITRHKAADQVKHEVRLKRGGSRVVSETDLAGAGPPNVGHVLDLISGPDPTPDFVVMVTEECCHLLDKLRDDSLREIALLKMEGYTNDEIVGRLGCARRTVARKLVVIRKTWLAETIP
jgi:DNA-directed RNA polymerase specialized sigma24 family protein